MNNKFNENAFTGNNIDEQPITAGNIHIDLNIDNKPTEDLPFGFYHAIDKMYIDVNSDIRLDMDEIVCTYGHPSKRIDNPVDNQFYYDTKNRLFYIYTDSQFVKIIATNEVMLMDVFY